MTQLLKVTIWVKSAGKQLEQFIPIVTASKIDYYKVHLLDCNTEDA